MENFPNTTIVHLFVRAWVLKPGARVCDGTKLATYDPKSTAALYGPTCPEHILQAQES